VDQDNCPGVKKIGVFEHVRDRNLGAGAGAIVSDKAGWRVRFGMKMVDPSVTRGLRLETSRRGLSRRLPDTAREFVRLPQPVRPPCDAKAAGLRSERLSCPSAY
jgi:hypothetical protein